LASRVGFHTTMRVLVTGSSGHLGEALLRTLKHSQHEVVGLDLLHSPCTTDVGSIVDRACVSRCMDGVEAVFHAATLHKPHIATHSRQDFVDTNITGTLNLLEKAVTAGVGSFVFTSTTSAFGDALVPPPRAPCGMGDGRGHTCAKEHLWCHQGGGRGSLPAVPQEPRACVHRAQDLAIFPRGRRQQGHA
jgi:nucleoside-diphosphate-sugar epimerase